MTEFKNTLKNAVELCRGNYIPTCHRFTKLYPFTTENISGYINQFDLKDKSLLTVGSSGDQILNAIYQGSKDITLLDINTFAKYYYFLKAASILCLDYEEFWNFLSPRGYEGKFILESESLVLHPTIFNKVKNELKMLDHEAFEFWNTLIEEYNHTIIRERLFSTDEYSYDVLKECNCYLKDSDAYLKARKHLQDVIPKFICGNVFDAPINNYDNIWLSNIAAYIPRKEKIKELTDMMAKHLNPDGKLLISYLYKTTLAECPYDDSYELIYNVRKMQRLLSEYDVKLYTFQGIQSLKYLRNKATYGNHDSILAYQKKMI